MVKFCPHKLVDEKGLSQIALDCSLDPGVLAIQLKTNSASWNQIKRQDNRAMLSHELLIDWLKSTEKPNLTYKDLRELVSCGFEIEHDCTCVDCIKSRESCRYNMMALEEHKNEIDQLKKKNTELNKENRVLRQQIAELNDEKDTRKRRCSDAHIPDTKQTKIDRYFQTSKPRFERRSKMRGKRPLRERNGCYLL